MPSTILIVDDSVTILMSMEAILARGGFTVTTAASGEDSRLIASDARGRRSRRHGQR